MTTRILEVERTTLTEIIEILDDEDSKGEADRAAEEKDLKKFQPEVHRFLAELIRKTNPANENVPSSLGSKLYTESVESYRMNNGNAIGIAMTKEVKKAIALKFFLFMEIRNTVEYHLRNHLTIDKKATEVCTSFSLEFLHDIIESKKAFENKLVSKDLTGDHKLWIANQVKFKMAGL